MASSPDPRSTPHQRMFIRSLMRQAELPTEQVTVMHRDLFKAARMPWTDGVDLDAVLCAASRADATRLIAALQAHREE